MPIPSQFALSVELTKLIPLILNTPPGQAVMKLARELQVSGSDIVTEEDLATKFGRCRIDGQLAATFKTLVSQTASAKLCEGIALHSGPGPTVTRAFAPGQSSYFAMVVQLSLLTATLGNASLASALLQIFEKELESAPAEIEPRPLPSQEGIRSVLRSCEEQTAGFDWSLTLQAVALQLSLPNDALSNHLPAVILRGLVYMLPITQSLPENRLIHIEIDKHDSICPIIVWAHHICSLGVTVIRGSHPDQSPISFGKEPSQLVITVKHNKSAGFQPSITLFESWSDNTKEPLLTLSPDPDEFKVEAVVRTPIKGYAKTVVQNFVREKMLEQEGIIEEISYVASGIALVLSKRLIAVPEAAVPDTFVDVYRSQRAMNTGFGYEPLGSNLSETLFEGRRAEDDDLDLSSDSESDTEVDENHPRLISDQQITRAAQFAFRTKNLKTNSLKDFITQFKNRPIWSDHCDIPRRIETVLVDGLGLPREEREEIWRDILSMARYLAVFIMALASVRELEVSAELPLSCNYKVLAGHPLLEYLLQWRGKSLIPVGEMTWFNAMSLLLMSSGFALNRTEPTASLLSDHGWTIYLDTFDQPAEISTRYMQDPASISPGCFSIRKGTPTRNSVTKHAVYDGPTSRANEGLNFRIVERAGATASLGCFHHFTNGRAFYGERQDSFYVTLRLHENAEGHSYTRRTGYSEMFSALWMLHHTLPCQHATTNTEHSQVKLEPGYVTVSGAVDNEIGSFDFSGGRVLIALTAHNQASRWHTLIAIAQSRTRYTRTTPPRALLRTRDCCLRCAIDQTAADAGRWWLIL